MAVCTAVGVGVVVGEGCGGVVCNISGGSFV